VPNRELSARLQALIDELKKTTSTAEELARKVAEGIRAERRAGLPVPGVASDRRARTRPTSREKTR